ncbi:hypothetical protein BDN71DRAFT_1485163 [Pleurotus eryngii]|uniref:DUF6589 domain-containing protein n=1 Tax=Pleurotus eryngii TaxID=5323 RepID=A0A9P5ZIX1_PLEER|nr:hypothetical protein BDN71DRAFT_1485163 [Pleurotus eryngii]
MVLMHGDLLTGEHPWRHNQHIIYIMGLLINFVSILCKKEMAKIETKPGFHRMHEVIEHVRIVSWLNSWKVLASKCYRAHLTLEEFTKKKPSWEEIEAMSIELAKKHIAAPSFHKTRQNSEQERDKVNENMLLLQDYFLLYEELSYAMNEGDISRLESTFTSWVYIFQGCGKHKYVTQLVKYLQDVHFKYQPFDGLQKAIRTNILCNPTGQSGHFRSVDWWVEHNNLYLKRIYYGGKYSNHTKVRIIKESPLIETFKNVHIQVAKMFHLDHHTVKHSPAKLKTTFRALDMYMDEIRANEFVRGRDKKSEGILVGMTKDFKAMQGEDIEMMGNEGAEDGEPQLPDIEHEVEDDGDLDI